MTLVLVEVGRSISSAMERMPDVLRAKWSKILSCRTRSGIFFTLPSYSATFIVCCVALFRVLFVTQHLRNVTLILLYPQIELPNNFYSAIYFIFTKIILIVSFFASHLTMPTLNWIGKDKVINHHLDVPFKVLEHSYGFDNGKQTDKETGSGNMIIHGDNLEALKALLPQYEGKVKCIYIDPPYNTGNEGWVYNDNVNDPKIKKWLQHVVGKEGDDLTRHDKWLCMIYPRLKLLEKLLNEYGAIFISIDENEYSYLKLVCDEIFGRANFVVTIAWQKRYSRENRGRMVTHMNIL